MNKPDNIATSGQAQSSGSTLKDVQSQVVKNDSPSYNRSDYQSRYDRAIAAGMSSERAKQYANSYKATTVSDTFWSDAGRFLGIKTAREKDQERLNAEDDSLFNSLLSADYEEKYNSTEAQVQREQNAGLNTQLDPSMASPGEASSVDDTTFAGEGPAGLLETQGAEGARNLLSSMINVATSVASIAATGVDISSSIQALDINELTNLVGIAKGASDLAGYIPGLGQFTGTVDSTDMDGAPQTLYNFVGPDGKTFATARPVDMFMKQYEGNMRTKRGKRMARSVAEAAFSNLGSKARSQALDEDMNSRVSSAEAYSKLRAIYPDIPYTEDTLYRNFPASPAYQDFVSKTQDFYLASLEHEGNLARYQADYYDELNKARIAGKSPAEIAAITETYNNKVKGIQSQFQSSAYQTILDYFTSLKDSASKGDADAQIMLFLLMNPSLAGVYGADTSKGTHPFTDTISDVVDMVNPVQLFKSLGKGTNKVAPKKK